MKFDLKDKALKLFKEFKGFFVCAFMLVYYTLMHYIMLEYNTFKFTILAILSQLIKVFHSILVTQNGTSRAEL